MATGRPERVSYEGLAQVAHSIRRSVALYVAMSILPPDSTVDDLKAQAEDLSRWIGGSALAEEGSRGGSGPIGEAWPPEE